MFLWYSTAEVCYAYLSDVTIDDFDAAFASSRWHTRGWTLQELLAPEHLEFFDRDWRELGSKHTHANRISDITHIDIDALSLGGQVDAPFSIFSIAKRMSWASSRETTRVEDTAYCLLGLFNVNIPLLYGERERAFLRLQEELIKTSDDDSILAWDLHDEAVNDEGPNLVHIEAGFSLRRRLYRSILASSPAAFQASHRLEYDSSSAKKPFSMTNTGLQIDVPLAPLYERTKDGRTFSEVQGWVGILNCSTGQPDEFLGILLAPVRRAAYPPMSVGRTSYFVAGPSETECHTVIVGPRTAIHAVHHSIVISRLNQIGPMPGSFTEYTSVVVTEDLLASQAGIEVYDAVSRNVRYSPWRQLNSSLWNQSTKVLRVRRIEPTIWAFFRFHFRVSSIDAEFTVFARQDRHIVRLGFSASEVEDKSAFDYLIAHDECTGKSTIPFPGENGWWIQIALTEKTIAFSRMFELTINLVSGGEQASPAVQNPEPSSFVRAHPHIA